MPRHVLTLISSPNAPALKANSTVIALLRARLNPVRVVWLSAVACDFEFDDVPPAHFLEEALRITDDARLDAVLQPMETRAKHLLVSDMDSTMIAQECIDELADAMGLKARVSAITERAMNGELDFPSALRERVALLKGLSVAQLELTYQQRITLMGGARTLVQTMRHHGAKTLLVSGGFTFFTERVAAAIGFERQEANLLEIEHGELTGRVARTLAVGDGATDLPMIQTAGLGVAFHAKPVVQAAAPASIRFNDLTALLYIQGYAQECWVG
jgi:phosphoserine phosphatase